MRASAPGHAAIRRACRVSALGLVSRLRGPRALGPLGFCLRLCPFLVAFAFGRPVHAGPPEPTDLSLLWSAPAGCPQIEAVLSQVRDLAGGAYPGDPRLHVEGTITQIERRRYALELQLHDVEGVEVRRLEANACRELAGGAAVIIGLKLTRQVEAAGQRDAADTTGAPTTKPSTAAIVETSNAQPIAAPAETTPSVPPPQDELEGVIDASPEPRASTGPVWWVAVPEIGVNLGALSSPGITVQATIGRRFGSWAVAASGRYGIIDGVETTAVPNVSARVRMHAAALAITRGWRFGALALEPGVSGRAHYVTARGEGDDLDASSANTIVLQWGAELNLRWLFGDTLALRSTISAGLFVSRPRLLVDELGEVRRLGPGQLAFSLGPELSF